MRNCAVCHKPVKSGIVVHSECMELLQKTQQVDNKPLTNGDRIRAMSDDGLAEEMCGHAIDTICDIVCGRECCTGTEDGCIAKLLEWLKQPAEVE